MQKNALGLTPEQQFEVARFKVQVKSLTHEEAVRLLGELYESTIAQRVMYQGLVKKEWGL